MARKGLILVILLTISIIVNSQTQDTIYYNAEWKVCMASDAQTYRIFNFDANGKPAATARIRRMVHISSMLYKRTHVVAKVNT